MEERRGSQFLNLEFQDYATKYKCARMERRNGILQVTLHDGEGKRIIWGNTPHPHAELPHVFWDISLDPENKVVILTGCDGAFIDVIDFGQDDHLPPGGIPAGHQDAIRLLMNHLDIPVPMIAAVNGPALVHAELALLCDIVLASENAEFQDLPHFPQGLVPGDGVHVVWPLFLGPGRGRYFLLTGEKIPAQEAKSLGFVQEVLPVDRLLPRAWELAEQIASKPGYVARYARMAITQHLKRRLIEDLGLGLALEILSATQYWPTGIKR